MSWVTQSGAEPTRIADRWFVRLGILILGYDRLLSCYVNFRQTVAWTKVSVSQPARRMLNQRTRCIEVLERRAWVDVESIHGGNGSTRVASAAPQLLRCKADLKIAVFIPGFLTGKGGAERVAGKLAETLSKSGIQVDLVCRPPTASPPPYPLSPQVHIRKLLERDEKQIKTLKKERYDLMIGFAMRGFYLSIASIARQLEIPFVIQECNNPTYIGMNLRQENWCRDARDTYWLRQGVCAHAVGVRLTVPEYVESFVSDIKPFTYAFYNAFEVRGRSLASHVNFPDKKLVCVGAMKNQNKNGMAAVEAFCQFSSRNPGWSLHLYGKNRFMKQMQALLEKFPGARVVDHGIVDRIDEIYGDAHAHIIPSYNEGLPSVVIEALAYGVPSIGFSDCDGVKHIIQHEETGLLIDRDNPDSLTNALNWLADTELRQLLSANAIEFANRHLRFEQWQANWLRLVHNASNCLDNQGQLKAPAASGGASSHLWSNLLETYFQFSGYLGSGAPKLGKATIVPRVGSLPKEASRVWGRA
jgi:glycosyltransferase involved in cell wall biosynthesis